MATAPPKGPATCDFTVHSATQPAVAAGILASVHDLALPGRGQGIRGEHTFVRGDRMFPKRQIKARIRCVSGLDGEHVIVRGDRRFPPSGSSGRESGDRHVTGSLQKSRTPGAAGTIRRGGPGSSRSAPAAKDGCRCGFRPNRRARLLARTDYCAVLQATSPWIGRWGTSERAVTSAGINDGRDDSASNAFIVTFM